jgi:hypothetical protein
MAAARETMAVLIDRVEQGCEARGIPVTRMPAATWRSRIGAAGRRREGDERSGDERVRDGLRGALGDAVAGLGDVHQRDAAGVALALQEGSRTPRERRRQRGVRTDRVRKLGTRRMHKGHPSDAAFDRLMAEREAAGLS